MKTIFAILLMCGWQAAAQDMHSCPMHKERFNSSQHQADIKKDVEKKDVEKHGDQAMGFPHDKTTHHFRLYSDGGAIEVAVNDPRDSANLAAIRSHLMHITAMFSDGNFSIPMFIHSQVPPGVEVMKKERQHVAFTFEETAAGGRVRIRAKSSDTLKAVHDFLRFQIEDHQTGDSTDTISP